MGVEQDDERTVSRIAKSVYLTLFQRAATLIGLPVAGFIALQMYNELKTSTEAIMQMQGTVGVLVDTMKSQDNRIGRLESALFLPRNQPPKATP